MARNSQNNNANNGANNNGANQNTAPVTDPNADPAMPQENAGAKNEPAPAEKTYSAAEVETMIAEATRKAAEEAVAAQKPDPASQEKTYSAAEVEAMLLEARSAAARESGEEFVTLTYIAEVSKENVLELPGYGTIRPGSYLEIPKKEFGNKFMSNLARKLIDKRHLIVVSGLTKDERERWGCDYKEGEVLTEKAFDRFLDYDLERFADLFSHLCPEHQRFVCRRMISAKEQGDNRVSFAKAQRINDISKANDPEGMLRPVIEAYLKEFGG